jgi:hypothetical protein
MKYYVKAVLHLIIIVCLGLLLYSGNVLYTNSYNEFVQWVAESVLKKPHLVKFIPTYFNADRFNILQKVLLFVFVIYLGFLLWLYKHWARVVNYLTEVVFSTKFLIRSFVYSVHPKEQFERIVFWGIITSSFFIAVYNIVTVPVSYDEAVSYIDFVSKGPLVISSLYHTTNNHILSNMLSYISCLIFPDGETGQRLPLLIIFLVNCFLVFGLLKRFLKPYPALIGLAFFTASTPVYLYSFMARGYSLVILFVLVCLLAMQQLLLSPAKRYWVIFLVSSVLGMYSMPVIAYFVPAAYIYLFVFFVSNNKKQLIALITTGASSLLVVILLYTPVFFVSGTGALTQVVSDISTQRNLHENIIRNFKGFTNFYISSSIFLKFFFGIPVLIGITKAYKYYRTNNSKLILFLLILGAMPMLVTIVLRQGMFDRTWIYMTVVFSILFAFAFSQIKKKSYFIAAVIVTYVLQLVSSINTPYYRNQKSHIFTARKTADLFVEKKMKSIYLDHMFILPMIEYRLQLLNHPYELYVKKSNFRKSVFDPNKQYDLIVYSPGSEPPPSNYQYQLIDSVKGIRVLQLVK